MAHRSVERVLPSNQVISSSAPIAQKSTSNSYKPMSIAYQAALFSVRQSTATRQDLLAEQFSGTFDDEDLRRRKLTRAQKLFYAAGSLVFFFALVVSMQSILTNRQAKEQLGVLGAQTQLPDEYGVPEGTGNEPAEAEVPKAAMSAYKVSPELPRYIRIPELSVVARVKHSGVTKEGAIDAPANINDVSWYNQSAKPGSEIGASLLLGHVSGWTSPGVFKKINQLKSGMRFEIEMGSGEKITYEVTHGQSIPLSMLNMGEILTPEVAGEHDLKLMTCSGRFNREADQYEERYVVYAKIVR
jgi:sortase (surface protein transpeptidase)